MKTETLTSPHALVAIANAARRAGDKPLEKSAVQLLRAKFGIELKFLKPTAPETESGA
jgi:hypothetical protein